MTNKLLKFVEKAEDDILPVLKALEPTITKNHSKILTGFRNQEITDSNFQGSTGYGYGDVGREKLDSLYAEIFRSEAALVRANFISGTHTIWKTILGVVNPGEEIISVTGTPYDTLRSIFASRDFNEKWGLNYREIPLNKKGTPEIDSIAKSLSPTTKLAFIQRSKGYQDRRSLTVKEIGNIVRQIKHTNPDIICLVDNCYGEFVEEREPIEAGADLIAGSLIKNPGGGISPSGGYVAGREHLIEKIAEALNAPGLGTSMGATLTDPRILFQGLFLSPRVVAEALKGAIFTSRLFELLGFEVSPRYDEYRTDIVQAVKLGRPETLECFSELIQYSSPIDSQVKPEPALLPGYEEEIIMAAGTFVQGASIEFSADAPLKSPYWIYIQGGLSYEYVKLSIVNIAQELINKGLLRLAWQGGNS